MMPRRAFIQRSASLVCAVVLAPPLSRDTARVLRVGTFIDGADTDLEAGLGFGADEANRSAALFGWTVERVALSAPMRDTGDAHVIILGTRANTEFAVPVVAVRCDAHADAFVVADCGRAEPSTAGERIVVWHESLERFGAAQLNDRYRAATGSPMTSDAWTGWFAMKVIAESALRARTVDPHALTAYLASPATQFDGHKGSPLRFDARRRLRQPVYLVRRDESAARWAVVREIAAQEESR